MLAYHEMIIIPANQKMGRDCMDAIMAGTRPPIENEGVTGCFVRRPCRWLKITDSLIVPHAKLRPRRRVGALREGF
jgi:hypothetical protein